MQSQIIEWIKKNPVIVALIVIFTAALIFLAINGLLWQAISMFFGGVLLILKGKSKEIDIKREKTAKKIKEIENKEETERKKIKDNEEKIHENKNYVNNADRDTISNMLNKQ